MKKYKFCDSFLIYSQQDATLHSLFYLETALHVSGGTITHHQESKITIYSIWYLSHRYCYLPLALQVGSLRVRFPMVSLEFFIEIFLPANLWPWG